MTHTDDGLGFQASGKAGRLEGSTFLVVNGDRILNGWNQMNLQALMAEFQNAAVAMSA